MDINSENPILILVEGVADQQFLIHYLQHLYGLKFSATASQNEVYVAGPVKIQYTDGWEKIKETSFVHEIQKIMDNEGKVLVIFDADLDVEARRKDLLDWRDAQGLAFDLFLFPNDKEPGALEDLLESIINPVNKPIFDSWKLFEDSLKSVDIPWKEPTHRPTIPAKKTKIYAYIETLVGESKSQKKLIKERNRKYSNGNHWNLDSEALLALKVFLDAFFMSKNHLD